MGYHQSIDRFTTDIKCLCENRVVLLKHLTQKATGFMEQMTVTLFLCLFLCCFFGNASAAQIDTRGLLNLSYDLAGVETVNRDMNQNFGDQAAWTSENKLQKRYGIGPHHRVSAFRNYKTERFRSIYYNFIFSKFSLKGKFCSVFQISSHQQFDRYFKNLGGNITRVIVENSL